MNNSKKPIHTTISPEAMSILERHEKEMGCKNLVLERALFGMNKTASQNIEVSAAMPKLEIEAINPLLGKIAEGSVLGIIGPPMSGKTILACAILNDFLSHAESQCVFVSGRNKLAYLLPITNSLGMKLGNFAEKLFLDICETNTLDGIFRILQKSKPKIIVIDDLGIIQENGTNSLDVIFGSSGWNILSEEIRKQKTVCVLISENEKITRFCDIAIAIHKSKNDSNPIFAKVIKNIGLARSDIFKLEMNGRVKIVPVIELRENSANKHTKQIESPGNRAPVLDKENSKIEPVITCSKEEPKSANPEAIALELARMIEKIDKDIPNAPASQKMRDRNIYPVLMEHLIGEFSAESLLAFAEKYRGQNHDQMIGVIAMSLPVVLQERQEKERKPEADKNSTNNIALSRNMQKILSTLETAINRVLTRPEISAKTGISQSNLTGPLRKMEQAGIIQLDTSNKTHRVFLKEDTGNDSSAIERETGKTNTEKVATAEMVEKRMSLNKIATDLTYNKLAQETVKLVLAKSVKIASLEELAKTLRDDPEKIKKALIHYRNNGGKEKIEIEETKENILISVL